MCACDANCTFYVTIVYTVNQEMFVFKNLHVINFHVKKSSSASRSDKDFLTKFF